MFIIDGFLSEEEEDRILIEVATERYSKHSREDYISTDRIMEKLGITDEDIENAEDDIIED
jgi:hypothetical protein